MSELILASSSPQRLSILKKLNIFPHKVINPNIDEQPLTKEKPFSLVKRLSLQKLIKVQSRYNNCFIIAADTIVVRGTLILGKPTNTEDATTFLKSLSGRKHKVITGVSICNPLGKISTKVVRSTIAFTRLSSKDIQSYIDTNEWVNKAGGYTINGYAEMFVKQIIGSYSNILGLPTLTTCNMLKGLGYIHKWP